MAGFFSLPEGPVTLENLSVPVCFSGREGALESANITIANGRISAEFASHRVDMAGAMALPAFTDMHTHLDKGHIWRRAPNPDGTFDGALNTVAGDREANWEAHDVRARMNFALECAYVHGTRAIRTHLDSIPPQDSISWPVFREVREEWAGRIDLQGSCLLTADRIEPEIAYGETVEIVAQSDGVIGCVTFPLPDLAERLETLFQVAAKKGLSVDFHCDETGDASVATLRVIAETVLKTGFDAPVVVGHCCSLAVQEESEADRTLDLVAQAGLHVVSLPMCNLYLQARAHRRTPRWRGVTLVHEMKARDIPVSFASDNTRDPFYAYGDLDMVEVIREATRIAHLDHGDDDWIRAFTTTPSQTCGFERREFSPGEPADLVLFNARNWNEFYARPQADRIVIRDGKPVSRELPDYRELDALMERA